MSQQKHNPSAAALRPEGVSPVPTPETNYSERHPQGCPCLPCAQRTTTNLSAKGFAALLKAHESKDGSPSQFVVGGATISIEAVYVGGSGAHRAWKRLYYLNVNGQRMGGYDRRDSFVHWALPKLNSVSGLSADTFTRTQCENGAAKDGAGTADPKPARLQQRESAAPVITSQVSCEGPDVHGADRYPHEENLAGPSRLDDLRLRSKTGVLNVHGTGKTSGSALPSRNASISGAPVNALAHSCEAGFLTGKQEPRDYDEFLYLAAEPGRTELLSDCCRIQKREDDLDPARGVIFAVCMGGIFVLSLMMLIFCRFCR